MSQETNNLITNKATKKRTSKDKYNNFGQTENGVIGITKSLDNAKSTISENSPNATVAIFSTKNVIWESVGKIEKGYNIVTEKDAAKWLTRSHVRIATPEEVAREYGK